MSGTDTPVLVGTDGPVATLTLNRPDKANALSEAMIAGLGEALATAAADPNVRVVVITAAGKIFSAGHDLQEMIGRNEPGYHEALFARCSDLMLAIRACPKPVIAKVQGSAVAAGCQLVASCDLAYAADHAKFGVNGINLGLFCSTPAVAVSRAVAPKHALDLLLTGRLIKADRAAEIGLINAAVPASDLDATVADAAAAIAAKNPAAIALGKAGFHAQAGLDVTDAYALMGARMAENIGWDDTRASIAAFVAGHR